MDMFAFTPAEMTRQPFRELLDGDTVYWFRATSGCHSIGCGHVFAELCNHPLDPEEWDCGCEGYVSQSAAESCYERFWDGDARQCRLYQIEHGQRYPKEE